MVNRPYRLHTIYPIRPQSSLNKECWSAMHYYGKNWRSIISTYRDNAIKWLVNGIMSCFPYLQYDDPRISDLHSFARDLETRIFDSAKDLPDYFSLINSNTRCIVADLQRQEFARFQNQITGGG